ncbi:MAG TPA: hypothetical protein VG276_18715 [Actinomycetes bacterium]|nr:hypothetical protein [Actinomycetes bacterium]
MSIAAHCASCGRELLLDQLTEPADGFRCPFCGFAFAPSYATVAPAIAARALAARQALVGALTELQSMTGDRLRLDRASVLGPVTNALPGDRQPA